MVEAILVAGRRELLHERVPVRVRDVLHDLAAQGALAERGEPFLQCLEDFLVIQMEKLLPKAAEVAEGVFVDEADEAVQFEQRVLERRRREQEFLSMGECLLEDVGDNVRGFVDVAESVGLVDDDEIPVRGRDVRRLAFGELVGTDHYRVRTG